MRNNFFSLSGNDIFVLAFGVFLLITYFFQIAVAPFRFESLIIVFLFLLTTRSQIEDTKFFPYLVISVLGLLFSTFLSPYGLLIFFLISLILYKKTNLL